MLTQNECFSVRQSYKMKILHAGSSILKKIRAPDRIKSTSLPPNSQLYPRKEGVGSKHKDVCGPYKNTR